MEVTISTTPATSFLQRNFKRALLSIFSAGWLAPLFAVLSIPCETITRELHWSKQATEVAGRQVEAAKREAEGAKGEVEAVKREIDLVKRQQALQPDRVRQAVENFQIAAAIFCGWLALVIAFWVWRLGAAPAPSGIETAIKRL